MQKQQLLGLPQELGENISTVFYWLGDFLAQLRFKEKSLHQGINTRRYDCDVPVDKSESALGTYQQSHKPKIKFANMYLAPAKCADVKN